MRQAMLLWGLGAVATLALIVSVPGLTETLKATPLSGQDWLAALAVPLVTTSWWEVWKLARWAREKRADRSTSPLTGAGGGLQ